jgi:hypothetical protein
MGGGLAQQRLPPFFFLNFFSQFFSQIHFDYFKTFFSFTPKTKVVTNKEFYNFDSS